MDNLNTHSPALIYEAFAPAEAKRLVEKLEIHHMHKHGSWLNMAEIEISVLSRSCLDGASSMYQPSKPMSPRGKHFAMPPPPRSIRASHPTTRAPNSSASPLRFISDGVQAYSVHRRASEEKGNN